MREGRGRRRKEGEQRVAVNGNTGLCVCEHVHVSRPQVTFCPEPLDWISIMIL